MSNRKVTSILSISLYVLAGFTLLLAVATLISAFGFRTSAEASLMIVRASFGPIADALINMLVGGVQNVGVVFAIIVFIISALLFTAGRLVSRSSSLSLRIQELETRLIRLEETGLIASPTIRQD